MLYNYFGKKKQLTLKCSILPRLVSLETFHYPEYTLAALSRQEVETQKSAYKQLTDVSTLCTKQTDDAHDKYLTEIIKSLAPS